MTSNLAGDAELAGWAMCQGKMGPAVKQRYEAMLEQDPDNARFKMLLDNWVAAKDHPTKETWTTWPQPPRRPFWASRPSLAVPRVQSYKRGKPRDSRGFFLDTCGRNRGKRLG